MLRKKEILTVLVLVVCCCSIACAETKMRTITTRDPKTGKTISKQVPVTPKETDPYEYTSVLVEAFVVQVSTDALAEVGINPIGQAPEGISIQKILSCLEDAEKGRVVSGAKLTARNGKEASVKKNDRIYVETERGEKVHYSEFRIGKSFSAFVRLSSEKAISVEYSYSETSFEENEDKKIPPAVFSKDWDGTATMSTGQPLIAGAEQNDDTVTFLILAATIQK